MMPFTSKPKHQDRNWLDLPSDVMANILNRIGTVNILENAQKVCTDWHKICKEPALWRFINLNDILSLVEEFSNMDYIQSFPTAVKVCKQAVDRSQGQLVDLTLVLDICGDLFHYVADRSSQLRRLELVCILFTRNLTTDDLMKFPLLEELNLYAVDISKEEIETLGRYCPKLKTLKVNPRTLSVTDTNESLVCLNEIAIAIGLNLVGLRYLELVANKMSNIGLQVILDNCHHLETLDLRGCFNIDLKGDLGRKCFQQIKHLKLPNDSLEGCPYFCEPICEPSVEDDYDSSDDIELLVLHNMTQSCS